MAQVIDFVISMPEKSAVTGVRGDAENQPLFTSFNGPQVCLRTTRSSFVALIQLLFDGFVWGA
jgi:hypothetical protein